MEAMKESGPSAFLYLDIYPQQNIETSLPICLANQLSGFSVIQAFADSYLQIKILN